MDFLIKLFSTDTIMATVFGYDLSYIEATATIFTLACIILAAHANIITFALGIISTTLYFIFFYQAHLYSSASLQIIFLGFNIYGYYQWTRPTKEQENENRQLKVSRYATDRYIVFAGIIAIGTIVWGYLMSNPPVFLESIAKEAQQPYLDAFILVASIVAQYMIAKKKIENWIIWIVVDIVATITYAKINAMFTSVLYGILILNAVYGLYLWAKMYKKNV